MFLRSRFPFRSGHLELMSFVVLGKFMFTASAIAAPSCSAAIMRDEFGEKSATILCSHDGGRQPTYNCDFTWQIKNVKGVESPLSSNFQVVRGDAKKPVFRDNRVSGEKIDREVSKAKINCK